MYHIHMSLGGSLVVFSGLELEWQSYYVCVILTNLLPHYIIDLVLYLSKDTCKCDKISQYYQQGLQEYYDCVWLLANGLFYERS
jgi:hypothetical protein